MRQHRILVVDDDSLMLDLYALAFSQAGFMVETAQGGALALEKLKGGMAPDVILSDVRMPTVDGITLVSRVVDEALAPGTICILISNLDQPEDIARGLATGAAAYLSKATTAPFDVVTCVRKHLRQ